MEYKIFKYLRDDNSINIPVIFRIFFGILLIMISIVPILLPIFPGSLLFWVVILVIWLILIVPANKIKLVIKIRKGITYLFQNIHNKKIIRHKVYDIKNHIFEILDKKNNIK